MPYHGAYQKDWGILISHRLSLMQESAAVAKGAYTILDFTNRGIMSRSHKVIVPLYAALPSHTWNTESMSVVHHTRTLVNWK